MVDRRSWMLGVGCVLALLTPGGVVAQGEQLLATVDKPAVVTVTPSPAPERVGQGARVILLVTGFQPPQDGATAEFVVKAQQGTQTEREIGRFGIFPHTEFKVTDPTKGQRYGFSLPKELVGGPVKLKVELIPLRGEGKGATLQLGGAEIQ